jgi:hypothetical protein
MRTESARSPRFSRTTNARGSWIVSAAIAAALVLTAVGTAGAGKVVLKSGFEISGTPARVPGLDRRTAAAIQGENVPTIPYWLVDDGIRRYFVHRQNLLPGPAGVDQSSELSKYVTFKIDHLKRRSDQGPAWVGRPIDITPWDEHGRCRITLRTPRGQEHIQLAIDLVHPHFLSVTSTSHVWDFAVAPSTISVERLRQIIGAGIDESNPEDRLAVVRYFLQAGMLAGARQEIDTLERDFPELAARAAELRKELLESYGLEAVSEVLHRRDVGQHQLAQFLVRRILQEDLNASTLRDAREVLDDYRLADDKMRVARSLLGRLQAELDPEQASRLTPFRATIDRELNYETLPRLEAFLRVAEAPDVPAAEKLALAYSGWVLGAANARTQLNEAIALWDARFLVLEYLRPDADRADHQEIEETLGKLEGISVNVVSQMIPLLPPATEFPASSAAVEQSFELPPTIDSDLAVRYTVQVPPEYNPAHSYPAIVLLRSEDRTTAQMLAMWGGTVERPGRAQRQGYILIAPEYAPPDTGAYDYGRAAHETVVRALNDARQRLNIDSDRIFLSGHGMGADAAFDLGLTRSDLWAGVIPVCGRFQHAAALAVRNARGLPFYVVGGERDGNTLAENAPRLVIRMQRGDDLIYCEYKDRGYEAYAEEIPRIFDWMSRYRRLRTNRDLDLQIVRDFDNRQGWLKWFDLPEQLSKPIVWETSGGVPRPMPVSGRITSGNAIFVKHPGDGTVVWLSPEFVDYDERLKVYVKSSHPSFNGFPVPDLRALLDDLRERGDRQLLYWTKLVL